MATLNEALPLPGALAGLLLPHILCTLTVFARGYSRLRLLRNWFADDSLVLLAWTSATIVCFMYLDLLRGRPVTTTSWSSAEEGRGTAEEVVPAGTWLFSAVRAYTPLIFYQLGLIMTKLSILAFYHRIFSPANSEEGGDGDDDDGGTSNGQSQSQPNNTNNDQESGRSSPNSNTSSQDQPPKRSPAERTLVRLTIAFLLMFAAGPLFAMTLLQCDPSSSSTFLFFSSVNDDGSPAPSGGLGEQCLPLRPLLLASTILHGTFDLWLVLLAAPCVARLRGVVSPRRRAGLTVALGLGVLVVVVGIVRGVVAVRMVDGVWGSKEQGKEEDGLGGMWVDYVWRLLVRRMEGKGGDGDGNVAAGLVQVVVSRVFAVLTVLEMDVAIVCASAPTLRPFLARMAALATGWGRGSDRGQDNTVVNYLGQQWRMENSPTPTMRRSSSVSSMTQQHHHWPQQLYSVGNVCHLAPRIISVPPPSAPRIPQPPPALTAIARQRAPATLSSPSFVSSMTSQSRDGTEKGDQMTGWPVSHIRRQVDRDATSSTEKRRQRSRSRGNRSSVGCETLYQYIYDELDIARSSQQREEQSSRQGDERRSYSSVGWSESQESFVMGWNDPQSPKRLSPVAGHREEEKR